MGKANAIYKANKKTALRNYEQSLNRFYSQQVQNTVEKNLRDEQAKDTYKLNMQIRDQREDAKLEAFEKSEANFIDQLVYNEQAEKEALLGEEKVFNERILANAFETDATNIAYQKQVIESKYQYKTAERGIKDAVQDSKTNRALINLGAAQEKDQATAQQNILKVRKQEALAAKNTDDYKNRLQALRDEGTARASGRRGQSAARMLQSIQAAAGVNSALIADQLTKSELKLNEELTVLENQLGPQGYIEKERKLRTTQAKREATRTKRDLKAQQDQVAKALGITTEQFNMSREQLGRSLLSAADSYERSVEKIRQKKFASDMAAYANRQLTPRVQPEIPKPFETKLPIAIKPPKPVKPVKVKNGAQMGQDTNPVLQGISGLSGTVASVSALIPGGQVVAGVAGGISFGAQLLDKLPIF